MRILRMLSVFVLLAVCFPSLAPAQDGLSLSGSERWLVVASRQDSAQAIQIAKDHREALQGTPFENKLRVVLSKNGWFGVVIGPVPFKSIRLAKQKLSISLADDAYLSRGKRYVETVWMPKLYLYGDFESQKRHSFELEGLRIAAELVVSQTDKTDEFSKTSKIRVDGWTGDAKAFSFETQAEYRPDFGQSVDFIRLAAETDYPQVVIKQFTGGAHCCIEQSIITQNRDGHWMMINGSVLDGGYGYDYDDLDGDGFPELMSRDNSFLYLFASYAGSFAPLFIEKLNFDELTNVNRDPAYKKEFQTELTQLEEMANSNKALWKENGFLAAWAAVRARLGDGAQAVLDASTLSSGDANGFQNRVCPDGSPLGSCEYDDGVDLPFSLGLMVHLMERGYLTAPARAD
ncbi:hypothetical protein [Pseudovibrio sp. Tun.PSC04-5.I4]|uniref:hypothetical protein n=1 Tax=Pseudovibrio sp. Tun.PSC04-5.I4 TaxID=1798213 RepID=UPI00088A1C88|nr:hypothetical protein [Pseudovibrio sp. Tun.PSC04-5.I4]SDR21014.1 hypothetical protein SAMN04515695_3430 [Pseudovibrio sp. Tun.PSC04-5.I4]